MEFEQECWESEREDELTSDFYNQDGDMGFEDILEPEPWQHEMQEEDSSDDWREDARDGW